MATCRGCGGVLGRDCWNEVDCLQISQNQDNCYKDGLTQELEWKNSILIYMLEHHKIKIPDFYNRPAKPLVSIFEPIIGCENKYIDDGLPF